MDFKSIQVVFWVAMPALCAAWALRLWSLGLATHYPLLMAALLGQILLVATGYAVQHFAGLDSYLYAYFWSISKLVNSTLWLLVLVQVYQRLVERYEGFRRLGQIVLYAALGFASLIMLMSIFMDPSANLGTARGFWIVEERSVYLALTFVSLALLAFAVFFGLAPQRNVLLLFAVFSALFIGEALFWTLRHYWGSDFREMRLFASSTLHCVCLAVGTIAFSDLGEGERFAVRGNSLADRSDSMIARRLEELNRALLSVFRL